MKSEDRRSGSRPLPGNRKSRMRKSAIDEYEDSGSSRAGVKQWAIRIAIVFLGVLVVTLFMNASFFGGRNRTQSIAPKSVNAPLSGAMPWVIENLEIYENAGVLENLDLLRNMDGLKYLAGTQLK